MNNQHFQTTNKRQSSSGKLIIWVSILLFGLLWNPAQIKAQAWTESGSNVYKTTDGNVGVGTNNPFDKISIAGTNTNTDTAFGNQLGITLQNTSNTIGNYTSILNYNTLRAVNSGIYFKNTDQVNAGQIDFVTRNAFGYAARLSIAPSGNVGIGTTIPSARFDVRSSITANSIVTGISLGNISNTVGAGTALDFQGDQGGGAFTNARIASVKTAIDYSPTDLLFYTNNGGLTEKMRVTSNGKVGIGTANPGVKLHIAYADSATSMAAVADGFALQNTNTNSGVLNALFFVNSTGYGSAAISLTQNHTGNVGDKMILSTKVTGGGAWNDQQLVLDTTGSVGIGTSTPNPASKLHVAGDIQVDGNINAKYQDIAEWVESSQTLSSGTVVILDQNKGNQVVASTTAYDTTVAGVVSERPGVLLGEGGAGKAKIATTGRVKVRVDATKSPIKIGDLLVTSDVAGTAMKSIPIDMSGVKIHRPGTIVGKALEPLAGGTGEILVLLSLQ